METIRDSTIIFMKGILIIANLDTRGAEFAEFKDMIGHQGFSPLLMDVSMEQEPPITGDITCREVAAAGGCTIEQVRENYTRARNVSTECMIRGGGVLATRLYEQGRIGGVFGAGGATATVIATSIMKELPFGVPKLMATPVAGLGCYVDRWVGSDDIAMVNTVVDVIGMNPLLHHKLTSAVGAICGMVRLQPEREEMEDRLWGGAPLIGVTGFGLAEESVRVVLSRLAQAGFKPVAFHAQGKGDRALDRLIRRGLVQGVVEMVPRGLGEEMYGGDAAAGPDRVVAAVEMGLPLVVAPGGFDQFSVGAQPDWPERFGRRAFATIDEVRVEIRTSAEECGAIAAQLALRLNAAWAPYRVLVSTGGFSSLDRPGRALHDPAADGAFTEELERRLVDPGRLSRLDLNLYDPAFGLACSDAFLGVWQEAGRPLPTAGLSPA